VRDLFERYVPEDKRVQRLGATVDAETILGMSGDPGRGRALFFENDGLACKSCHKIGDRGGSVGPELTTIGKKLDRRKLLQSILDPSREIDPKYVTYLIETTDGLVLSGLLSRRTESLIELIDANTKHVHVETDAIERMARQQKSLMPDLLLKDLTAEQAADLLAYLQSLR